jgi:hypothetical protein
LTSALRAWLAEIEQRAGRHSDVLDTGGTELALIGSDIERLVQMLRRSMEALEEIRECVVPQGWTEEDTCSYVTAALTDLAAMVDGGTR